MVPSDRVLSTSYRLTIESNLVFICSSLAAVLGGKFQAISGRILEVVRYSPGQCY